MFLAWLVMLKKAGQVWGTLLSCLLFVVFKQWRGGLVFMPGSSS